MRRLSFVLLAAAVAFALAQSGRSAEPPPTVALLAIGDFGVAGSRERNLGVAMRRFEAQNDTDALVTLGDNDYTESPAAFRAAWGQSFGWLRPAGVAVAGSLGNLRRPRAAGPVSVRHPVDAGAVLPPEVRLRGALRA